MFGLFPQELTIEMFQEPVVEEEESVVVEPKVYESQVLYACSFCVLYLGHTFLINTSSSAQ